MRVFQMNDCDWWMAESMREAIDGYMAFGHGLTEDAALYEPHELTDAELDRLIFTDEDNDGNKVVRSFREELECRIAGGYAPGLFASTEY